MYSTLILLFFVSGTFAGVFFPNNNFPVNRFFQVVVFGDSYSDTGNVYKLTHKTFPITPPYHRGRYCNGPNWVDDLEYLLKSDYAYGSATTDNNLVQGLADFNTVPVPGILQQVGIYLSDPVQTFLRLLNPVYVIWGGGNDLLFNPTLSLPVIVNSLMDSVRALIAIGAQNIIVFNQPPLQIIPLNSKQNKSALFIGLTAYSNNAIFTSLQALQANYTGGSLHMFNLYQLITDIRANPPPPITNTVDNCWDYGSNTTVIKHCSDPTTYLFLDEIHFSSTVQAIIANAIQPFFFQGYTPNAPGSYIYSFNH